MVYHLHEYINCEQLLNHLEAVNTGRPPTKTSGCYNKIYLIKKPANLLNKTIFSTPYGMGTIRRYYRGTEGYLFHCIYPHGSEGIKKAVLNEENIMQEIKNFKTHVGCFDKSAYSPDTFKTNKRKVFHISNV